MQTTAPAGIVDTLSEGYLIINRRLWVLLLPILLDLLLAFGPGVSATPLVENALGFLDQAVAGQTAGEREGPFSREELNEALGPPKEALAKFRDANLLGILAWQLPSLISATSTTPLPAVRGTLLMQVEDGWLFAGGALVLAALSLLGMSFYMAAIAQPLREETGIAQQAVQGWLKMMTLYGALLLLSLPVGGGMLLFLGLIGLLGSAAVSFASGAALAMIMTVAFYMFFVDDAIFVAGASPWRAIWYSTRVVWRHFWSAVGFILLVNLILLGTPLAWRLIVDYPLAAVGAMAGHAYIVSGLVAAGMLFLRARLNLNKEAS